LEQKLKKRELEFLDVSFPKSGAPIKSHQKSHVGQPVRIHQSGATKTRDEATRSFKRVFSRAVDRRLPMKSTDSKHAEARFRTFRPHISAAVPDIAPIASWKCKMPAKSRDSVSFTVTAAVDNPDSRCSRPESPRRRVRKPRRRRALGQKPKSKNKRSTLLYWKTS
jgi:hypothetical protein